MMNGKELGRKLSCPEVLYRNLPGGTEDDCQKLG
jgi:hypothetical protein